MIEVMLLALTLQQPAIGSDAFNVDAELQGMSVSGSWKLKLREQLGQPTVAVDKPELST
jgi:hypothetical protein